MSGLKEFNDDPAGPLENEADGVIVEGSGPLPRENTYKRGYRRAGRRAKGWFCEGSAFQSCKSRFGSSVSGFEGKPSRPLYGPKHHGSLKCGILMCLL